MPQVSRHQPYYIRGELMGHLPHIFLASCGQWAGEDYQAHLRHAQRRRSGMSRSGKSAGYHANRRDSLGLGFDSVVETPRRARPSIRNGVNHHIALGYQGIQCLICAGSAVAEFSGVYYPSGPKIIN